MKREGRGGWFELLQKGGNETATLSVYFLCIILSLKYGVYASFGFGILVSNVL